MEPMAEGEGRARTTAAVGVLVVEAGLAVLGVLVHYSFTAMYGDVTDLAVEGWSSRLSSGIGGVGLVGVVALVSLSVARQRWARLVAVAIPVLMFGAMLVVTPAALRDKLASQYSDTPQCVDAFETGPGPGADAVLESQRAFESIQHVGHFGGGGGSGVVGCDRSFELIEEVDVLQQYRAALPRAGWRVVEDDTRHLRAERDAMAFEVILCGRGGVVWAGNADISGGARCRPAPVAAEVRARPSGAGLPDDRPGDSGRSSTPPAKCGAVRPVPLVDDGRPSRTEAHNIDAENTGAMPRRTSRLTRARTGRTQG